MAKTWRLVVGVLFLAAMATACANGDVTQAACKGGLALDGEGALDYAVTNRVTLVNRGKAGQITVYAKVSTDEGEYERQRSLHFEAGEERDVDFLFTEPTVSAGDIRCEAAAFP